MAIDIGENTEITEVILIDLKKGMETKLFEKPGSRCHFNETFKYNEYYIQLRIDWKDLVNGDPTLDADIYKIIHGKKVFLKKKDTEWHRTHRELNDEMGLHVYAFKFEDLELCLNIKKSIKKTITADVRFEMLCEPKLIKGK